MSTQRERLIETYGHWYADHAEHVSRMLASAPKSDHATECDCTQSFCECQPLTSRNDQHMTPAQVRQARIDSRRDAYKAPLNEALDIAPGQVATRRAPARRLDATRTGRRDAKAVRAEAMKAKQDAYKVWE